MKLNKSNILAALLSYLVLGNCAIEAAEIPTYTEDNGGKKSDRDTMAKLGRYPMLIICRYLNTIEDYKNVEMCCKEYNDITGMFKENPIPFENEKAHELFGNIETYNVYDMNAVPDYIQNDPRIKEIIYQNTIHPFLKKYTYKIVKYGRDDVERDLCNITYARTQDFNPETLEWSASDEYVEDISLKEGSIELENGITSLGANTFMFLDLEKITLPTTLKAIENGCFFCCGRLTTINIPSSVTSIGGNCFKMCNNLTEIAIEEAPNDKNQTVIEQMRNEYPDKTINTYRAPTKITVIEMK